MTHSKVDSGLNIWNVVRTADFSNVKPLYFGILKNTFFDDLNEFDALIGSNAEVIWLVDMNDESVFFIWDDGFSQNYHFFNKQVLAEVDVLNVPKV